MKIAYFVPELGDAAARRRRTLLASAAQVAFIGFVRSRSENAETGTEARCVLGQTENARLGRRILSVFSALARFRSCRSLWGDADVIIARNLEMLFLGRLARAFSARPQILVYECLDIHRVMLGRGMTSRVLRLIERVLLRSVDGIVTSSPAFEQHYFRAIQKVEKPVLVVENRLAYEAGPAQASRPPSAAAPWRIVWAGVLRCRRSLEILKNLVQAYPGGIELVLWGQPARDELPSFDSVVAETPGLSFRGRYSYPQDLAEVYRGAHFVWAIDCYDEGLNSKWLLPNRLYEGGAHGVVPIAAEGTQTAEWLQAHGAGLIVQEPMAPFLETFFRGLTPELYQALSAGIRELPADLFVQDKGSGAALLNWIAALKDGGPEEI